MTAISFQTYDPDRDEIVSASVHPATGVKPGAALVGLDHKDRPRLVLACLTDEVDG